ncbi:hypothetical protein CRUP_028717, partial [Coryphaenoides rupestris]
MVVRFGEAVSANCSTALQRYVSMGWEAPVGAASAQGQVAVVTWSVASLKTWSIRPLCYITITGYEDQCDRTLQVTVYKPPDSVSVSELGVAGPMQVGRSYQLQCDVTNIAPVRNLSVVWYRGNDTILTDVRDNAVATPQNESFVLNITPEKSHHGVQIQCQVQQDLGSSGPAATWSEPYVLRVTYPPSFFSPLPETLDLAEGAQPVLNCSADGNPSPTYEWWSSAGGQDLGNQSVFSPSSPLLPGTYNCTASNQLASVKKFFIVTQSSQ